MYTLIRDAIYTCMNTTRCDECMHLVREDAWYACIRYGHTWMIEQRCRLYRNLMYRCCRLFM